MGKETIERTIKAYVVSCGNTEGEVLQGVGRPLSPVGRIQAEAAANALVISGIVSIASSNLPGVSETARIMGNSLGAAKYQFSELEERRQGSSLMGPGESYSFFLERITRGFNAAISRASRLDGEFVIVSDGDSIQAILENLGQRRNGASLEILNGSVTLLTGKRNGTLENFQFESTEVPIIE